MKWQLLNGPQRLRFAMHHPGYALKMALRDLTWADERFLAAATNTRAREIHQFLQEPFATPEFLLHLRHCESVFRQGMVSADLWAKKVLVQYAAVRALTPQTVVETGVASGVSSAYLLLALARNQKGTLHSVDLSDASYLPAGQEPGWIVPDWLRTRWRLHMGDVAAVLPSLLRDLGEVDIFIHDSRHTYDHMKFEFELAYPHIRRGGLLLADDALWNSAFRDVVETTRSRASVVIRGVGFLRI